MSGLYTLGTTCATRTTGNTVYSSSYDAWGNMSSRSTGGIASTLSYDALDHLVHWDGHAGTSEDYLYDASGERVLRRAVKSNGKEIYTYPFGLMDIRYSSNGVQVLENDYYALAGRLIGEQESGVTVFLLTDELGSVLTSISAVAGSAAVTSNQVYSPYGAQRYRKGTVPTDKGFTGQYLDASGLNYDHARYYDAVVGRFVSADTVQGNAQGMDPYSYVGNNPETVNDPTGRMIVCPHCGDPGVPDGSDGGGDNGGHNRGYCNLSGCYDGNGNKVPGSGTQPPACTGQYCPGHSPSHHSGRPKVTQDKTPDCGDCVVNPALNKQGWGKVIIGGVILAAGIASLLGAVASVPFLDWFLGLARNLLHYTFSVIVTMINSGLSDILRSLYHPNRQLLIAVDVVKLILDVATIVMNVILTVTSLAAAAEVLGAAGSMARAVADLAKVISLGAGAYKTNLIAAMGGIGNSLLGGVDFWGNWNQFQADLALPS